MGAIDEAMKTATQRKADTDMVRQMLDQMGGLISAQASSGMDVTPGADGNLAAKAAAPTAVDPVVAKAAAPQAGSVAPMAAPANADLAAYMKAAGATESGGNPNAVNARTKARGTFQIMPSNYPDWAREAGVDPADHSPAAQDKVAGHKLQQYFDQFGSWGAVAVAWYAGPSAAQTWLKNPTARRFNVKQGKGDEPSINEYVNRIISRMGGAATPAPAPVGTPAAAPAPTAQPAAAPVAPSPTDRNPELNAFALALAGRGDAMTGQAGTFQIGAKNYRDWAPAAGVDGKDKSPEAQWKVASTQMAKYFEQYQDWGAVAVAWYAGPGKVTAWLKNRNDPQFNKPMNGNGPSVNQYVQQALAKMRQAVA